MSSLKPLLHPLSLRESIDTSDRPMHFSIVRGSSSNGRNSATVRSTVYFPNTTAFVDVFSASSERRPLFVTSSSLFLFALWAFRV